MDIKTAITELWFECQNYKQEDIDEVDYYCGYQNALIDVARKFGFAFYRDVSGETLRRIK